MNNLKNLSNGKLWGKLVLLIPIIFFDNLRITLASFFLADFNSSSFGASTE